MDRQDKQDIWVCWAGFLRNRNQIARPAKILYILFIHVNSAGRFEALFQ